MARRPVLITLAIILAVILLAPIVMLAIQAASPQPPAGASTTTSASPTETDAVGGDLNPETVPWMSVVQHFDAAVQQSFNLQAGTLGAVAPTVDIEVPWMTDAATEGGRMPAAGQVGDGSVVYVSDDGRRSTVHLLGNEDGAQADVVGDVQDVVWSMAVTRDGRHAYLALGERGNSSRHTGVVRLELDGSGKTELVMPGAVAGLDDIRLVAVSSLVQIQLGVDDRQLIRHLCSAARGCQTDVLDLASGETMPFGDIAVLGVAADAALVERCREQCTKEVVDLETGASVTLDAAIFEARIHAVGGRPVVIALPGGVQGPGETIERLDPSTGGRELLFRSAHAGPVTLFVTHPSFVLTLPAGHFAASVSVGEDGASFLMRTVAVPLDGGPAIELPSPPFRAPPGAPPPA
jgi:hypothetical protein